MLRSLIIFWALLGSGISLAQQSPCYWSGQLVKCFPQQGIALGSGQGILFGDATTNYVELKAPSSVTTYTVTWPGAQGTGALTNDGSGGLTWSAGGGSVTSVGLALPSIFTVSGSPVTGTGTLTGTLNTEAANTVFAGPMSGVAAVPTFRGLGLTDIPGPATTSVSGYLTSTDWTTFNGKQASGSYITALTSDVTATGPGSVAATVNSVGGVTAANVATGANLANAATNANTINTIVKRDGSGNFTATTITAALSGNATNVTGTVAIANGGTGQTAKTAAFDALQPMTTLGDIMYGGTSGTGTRFAGNTSATKNFLTQTGTGTVSAIPAWATIAAADISSGTLAVARGGTNLASGTSGGVLAYTATGTLASSGALTANGLVLGGGAGAVPTSTAACTTANTVLRAGSPPSCGSLVAGDLPASTAAGTSGNYTPGAQPGFTGGTTIAAANLGANTVTTATTSTNSPNTSFQITSVTLGPGSYVLSGTETVTGNSTNQEVYWMAISTTASGGSTTSYPGTTNTYNFVQGGFGSTLIGTGQIVTIQIPTYFVDISAPSTTYYLVSMTSGTNLSATGTLTSLRRD